MNNVSKVLQKLIFKKKESSIFQMFSGNFKKNFQETDYSTIYFN